MTIAKPLVKWAGGKGKLLKELMVRMPTDFRDYFEPFVGGGALFFKVFQHQQRLDAESVLKRNYYISDINGELINMYEQVRDHPEELIVLLEKHKQNHSTEYYYKVRSQENLDNLEKASRMLYLNKTGYNGLYRVNRSGKFNVPIGKYKNPNITQRDNINRVSTILNSIYIGHCSFENIVPIEDDFVYLDPPYIPIAEKSFVSYTANGFDNDRQIKLRDFVKSLDSKGVKFMLSNSDTELTRKLYDEFNIDRVYTSHTINSNTSKRRKISELIVRNYR